MKKNQMFCLLLIGMVFFATACGSSDGDAGKNLEEEMQENSDDNTTDDQTAGADDLQGALNQMQDAVKKLQEGNGEAVEVIDFRKLKEKLPERIGDLKKVSSGGEKTGVMGFKVSQAEAKYEDGDSKMEVSIVDVGGVSMALISMAAWSSLDIDRESDEEIERTTTIEGHKALEKYYFKSRSGETNLLVNKRFVVKITGKNVEREDFTRAVKRLDLNELDAI